MFVGIDISKLKIDVCCIFGEKKRAKVFSNNEDGFRELLKWIEGLNIIDKPIFCMEATGCYHESLAEFIYNSGYKVSVVNPLLIKRFRESKMIRNKTDKSDAFVIAEFSMKNDLEPWTPKPLEIKELQDINKYIHNLKEELNRWKNRLEKRHCNNKVMESINKKIKELNKEIKELEKEMKSMIDSSTNLSNAYEKLIDIKGIGTKLITMILTEIPNVNSFKNAEQYAAYVGVTPCQHKSGSSINRQSRISRRGNPYVRKVLYMAAMVVKNRNPYFTSWINKLKINGKSPKVIIVAIMRKLLHIIFGMLKNNTKFNHKLAFSS